MVIAGGAEAAIMALNVGAFARMGAMSTRNDEPERASRPFDKGRDGFVLGEGAGVVILESQEHALARGARIYAVAAGAGYSSDAHHISLGAPDGEGVAFAISAALRNGGISPSQVVHINAHATSTPGGDPLEARAIETAFGSDAAGVVVSATKSMTGHLLGGAGAVETVAAIMALRDRTAPPTINLDDPDDDLAIDVTTKPRPLAPRVAGAPMAVLNDAFGFGGHNVALAFTEYVPRFFEGCGGLIAMTAVSRQPAACYREAHLPRDPIARLAALFDPGTMSVLTTVPHEGSGAVAAAGLIDGSGAVAFASDPRVQGGAMGTEGCAVIVAAYDEAIARGVPIIGLWHSGGARLAEGVA